MEFIKNYLKPYHGLPKEVYVIFVARIINAMGMFVFPLLTLIMTKKIGLSDSEAGYMLMISGLLFIPASLIGGKIADNFGRRNIIMIFDSLAAVLFTACAFVEPSMTMIWMIILPGTMMGFSDPAHNALIADVTTPENREQSYSLSYWGFNIGFIIGPALGGLLFENYLTLLFVVDALTAGIAVFLITFFIGETIHKTAEISDENEMEQRVSGSIFRVLYQRPILILFSIIMFGYNFTYAQWSFLMPLQVESLYSAGLYGLLASFNGAVVMIFTPLITSMFQKYTNIGRMIIGGALYVVGFGMMGFIEAKALFVVACLIFTWGEIVVTISTMPFIANHTPASHRGRMSSILPMIMGMGYTIGPYIMGLFVEEYSYAVGWQAIGGIMIVSTFGMFLLKIWDKNHQKKEIEVGA